MREFRATPRTCCLKARQQGFSWIALSDALHEMLFNPIAVVLVFSKTDIEAMALVGSRLSGMIERLPAWMKEKAGGVVSKSAHRIELGNGSRAQAFPTTGGRSYTGTLAIVDEADYMPNLENLLASVKPTVDAGGRMLLISTTDKTKPASLFKAIYRAGESGGYRSLFYPWSIRPGRTPEWYEKEKRECLATTGTLDLLWQEYPSTAEEALSANVLDKRFPPQWVASCFKEMQPVSFAGNALVHLESSAPSLPALKVFKIPEMYRRYVIGADPAQGNPTSDDSAFDVLDSDTGEQVATLAGKFEPAVFASMVDAAGQWYNGAGVMVERNNHGWAVLLWLKDNSRLFQLAGHDGQAGWHTTTKSKAILWDTLAERLRAGYENRLSEGCIIHDRGTAQQIESIEGASFAAPEGLHDDRAICFALACCGIESMPRGTLGVS